MKDKLIQQRRWELMTESWEKQEKKRLEENKRRAEEQEEEIAFEICTPS